MADIQDTRTFETVGTGSGLDTGLPTFERGISELGTGSLDSSLQPGSLAGSLGTNDSHDTAARQLGTVAFGDKVHSHEAVSKPQTLTSDINAASQDQPLLSSQEHLRGTSTNAFSSSTGNSTFPASSVDLASSQDQPNLARSGLESNFPPSGATAGVGAGASAGGLSSSSNFDSSDSNNLSGNFTNLGSTKSALSSALPGSSTSSQLDGSKPTTSTNQAGGQSATSTSDKPGIAPTDSQDGREKHNDHITNLVTAVAGVALTAPKAAVEVLSGHASNATATLQQTANEQGLAGVAQQVSATLSGAAASAQPYVAGASQSLANAAQTAQAKINSVRDPNAPALTEQASQVGSSITASASQVTSSITASASNAAQAASATVASLATQAQEAIHHLGERVGIVSPVETHSTGVQLPVEGITPNTAGVDSAPPAAVTTDPLQKEAPVLSGKEVKPEFSYSQV